MAWVSYSTWNYVHAFLSNVGVPEEGGGGTGAATAPQLFADQLIIVTRGEEYWPPPPRLLDLLQPLPVYCMYLFILKRTYLRPTVLHYLSLVSRLNLPVCILYLQIDIDYYAVSFYLEIDSSFTNFTFIQTARLLFSVVHNLMLLVQA